MEKALVEECLHSRDPSLGRRPWTRCHREAEPAQHERGWEGTHILLLVPPHAPWLSCAFMKLGDSLRVLTRTPSSTKQVRLFWAFFWARLCPWPVKPSVIRNPIGSSLGESLLSQFRWETPTLDIKSSPFYFTKYLIEGFFVYVFGFVF